MKGNLMQSLYRIVGSWRMAWVSPLAGLMALVIAGCGGDSAPDAATGEASRLPPTQQELDEIDTDELSFVELARSTPYYATADVGRRPMDDIIRSAAYVATGRVTGAEPAELVDKHADEERLTEVILGVTISIEIATGWDVTQSEPTTTETSHEVFLPVDVYFSSWEDEEIDALQEEMGGVQKALAAKAPLGANAIVLSDPNGVALSASSVFIRDNDGLAQGLIPPDETITSPRFEGLLSDIQTTHGAELRN